MVGWGTKGRTSGKTMTKEKRGSFFWHVWEYNRSISVEGDIFNMLNSKLGISNLGSKQFLKKYARDQQSKSSRE